MEEAKRGCKMRTRIKWEWLWVWVWKMQVQTDWICFLPSSLGANSLIPFLYLFPSSRNILSSPAPNALPLHPLLLQRHTLAPFPATFPPSLEQ
ncbi:hypothetical protein BJY00DRAFT_286070 [Aspergillus carlsbadensis]|nr:hypothetical protein BJY00DRAFT_286070 [Aspergillus carlsbadensis]